MTTEEQLLAENSEEQMEKKEQNFKRKAFQKGKFAWWCLAIFFLLILPLAFYLSGVSRSFFSGFLKRLPYPAVWIKEGGLIYSRQWLSNLEAVKIFYRSEDFAAQGWRIDFSTQDGKDRLRIKEKDILDKLIEDRIVEKLAKEKGIEVSEKEAEKDILEKVKAVGNEKNFVLNLKQNYGWGLQDFRDEVVIPQLYLKKLTEWYWANDQSALASKEKINQIKEELEAKGKNFSDLAKKYSEGESAKNGGDLGWFRKEELVPEVASKVFDMQVGQFSDPIESSLGWHLVILDQEREKDENEQKIKEVKIRQIFLSKGSFLEWLTKEKSRFGVWIFVRDFSWNKAANSVDFRDDFMRQRELDLRLKAEGDPSI